jgi:hypothetical protein
VKRHAMTKYERMNTNMTEEVGILVSSRISS